jgi:hypothetical protein
LYLASKICKSIGEVDDNILITAVLQDSSALSWYSCPKTPVPNKERQEIMAIQVQPVTSIVRNNEDYLGMVGLRMIRQKMADMFLFPVHGRPKRVFCVVVQGLMILIALWPRLPAFWQEIERKNKSPWFSVVLHGKL